MSGQPPGKPEFPKPFDFVPFANQRRRDAAPGHDAFRHLSGRLEYDLVVVGFLHVSSGTYALPDEVGLQGGSPLRDHYRVTADGETTIAVPGSTLKGSARAVVEAVTASCIVSTRQRRDRLPDDLTPACRPPAKLCPACALFGAMSRLGRVRFGDALLTTGGAALYAMPPLFRPLRQESRYYFAADGKFRGRKFYYHGKLQRHVQGMPVEVITPRSRLSGWVAFDSLSEAELGLLLFGLGLDGSFHPLLGAGKPVAMGHARPEATALTIYQDASLLRATPADERLTGEALVAAIAGYLAAAEAGPEPLILAPQRDELRRILDPNNPRPAPTGTY